MINETAFNEAFDAANRTASHVGCTDWLGLLSSMSLPSFPSRETLIVTRKGYEALKKELPTRTSFDGPIPLSGIELRVVDFPLTKRVPKSLDRFAEYDERDMDWAVPAGLAKWVEVDVDAMIMRMGDEIERKFFMGLM